ncbi:uncharacterized protein DNG_05879 [Cephalotrichum gorgonifer]|uniref:RING-type E3 ubiquitin transferase n=1 Tax=Cephalotrichum gorgonifer TaxID=2041049 RepID=A0AAE8SWN6_9PEZI|nr:uncharacterized protein DNG_05879 [Cephalotrichum gorgonifer]
MAEIARQEINLVEDSGDDEYEDNRDDGLVPCPMCNRRMKEWQVFSHLDKCAVGPADSPRSPARELPTSTNFLNPSPRKQQTKFERLPAINYSMLKDQALRKKMSDLGISTGGSRALLERRHREWCTIWNANCDSVKPKSRPQLIRDLEIWERSQGGRATPASRLAQTSASVKDKDFDRGAWAAKHGSSFKDLIASARRGCPPKQRPDKVEGGQKTGDLSVADDSTTEQTATDDLAHAAGVDIIDYLVDSSTCEQRVIDDSADELELSVIDSMVDGACDQKAIEPGE